MPALAGSFSIFSPLPQQRLLPQEHLPFSPNYRSSVHSRRSSLSIFSTAAAVTAPAGALPIFPHYRSSECSPQERYLYFLTAPAVSAPAGALPIFPHCRSSARSSRSLSPPPSIFSLPQQCLLQQEPLPPSIFSLPQQCLLQQESLPPPLPPSIFSLPQQCLLQQEPLPPLSTAPTPSWESPPQLFSSLPQ